jgi:hypothetical protein
MDAIAWPAKRIESVTTIQKAADRAPDSSWTFVRICEPSLLLTSVTILERDGLAISDVACRHDAGRGDAVEQAGRYSLVFVRRGCFVRSADGVESLLDPTTAYITSPGHEERFDHPHEHGDDCTVLTMSDELVASLWGGDPSTPDSALPTAPEIDLEHRLLLSEARRHVDTPTVFERAVALVAAALEQVDRPRVASGRPPTAQARRLWSTVRGRRWPQTRNAR